ncbi:MAG: DUF72 domain-containing protein [Pseudomonadota bacterium]
MAKRKSTVNIGTSGWSYSHWKGPFYPADIRNDDMLGFYCEHFRTVEINNSFYHLPHADTLRHWYEETPGDFVFSVKASRYITHMKKLKDPKQSLHGLLERIPVLGEKLGPILFQLPPRWHCNQERLARFLDGLSNEFRYTFEFRDPSWLEPEIYELLSRHNAAFCIYELDGFISPREVTADFVYIRLHGPGGPYQGDYDNRTLAGWAGAFHAWREQGKEIYCYFDNDEAGNAARNAEALAGMLERR